MWLWAAVFVVMYGTGRALAGAWPPLNRYADTLILAAMAVACFINFARNRTLHCALTGPLFVAAALLAALDESGILRVPMVALWGMVLLGVVLALMIEWRTAGRAGTRAGRAQTGAQDLAGR